MCAVAIGASALLCLFALMPLMAQAASGSISGVVTDGPPLEGHLDCFGYEDPKCGDTLIGNGVEDIEVCAWGFGSEEEHGGCTTTGTEGRYEIANLPQGEYEVEFLGAPAGFAPQYYDGRSMQWEADPVVVSGPTTNIDAELVHATGIAGTVTRSADTEPVEGVEVCAWEIVTEELGGCGWTGPEGAYLIELEQGEYTVEFWSGESGQNLAYQVFDHGARWSEADVVAVTTEEIADVDAELDAGATIGGEVSSAATGAPLDEVPVCSIDAHTGQLWICDWTDSNGGYALSFLSEGEYKVVFSVDFGEWFEEDLLEGNDGYPTQFWDNQTTLANANAIDLSIGQSLGGINAQLGVPVIPTGTPTGPSLTRPVASPSAVAPSKRRCGRDFKRKRVKGKLRCVRKKRRHHQRSQEGDRPHSRGGR